MPKREVDDLSEPAVEKLKLTDEEISLLEKALMAGGAVVCWWSETGPWRWKRCSRRNGDR